jgi:PAS domain-containing protein
MNAELEAKVAEGTIELQATNQLLQKEFIHLQQAKATLQKSEEQYRPILETTCEGIWMLDTEGNTSFINPQMSVMVGYSVEQILGKPLFDFMGIEEQKIAQTHL